MRPESILEISSAIPYNSKASFDSNFFNSLANRSIERTSPQEPFEMNKKYLNSLLLLRSNPSAILFIIETEARCIWSLNP